ncbi:hypothetical protein ACQF36_27965 [Streptomyces sp. Marseille-Q5077]|uniref:hypothetical protein n=1 Tax=Streptomyces sp. Marseille-Q5077 TaxID=3418995 RepID=UPI003D060F1F
MHLDLEVTDLPAAVDHAVALGAGPGGCPAPGRRTRPVRPGGAPVLPLCRHRPARGLTGRGTLCTRGS